MRKLSLNTVVAAAAFGIVTSCGVAYHTPSVNPILGSEDKVRVVKITPESVLSANRSTYAPKTLPAAFFQTAGRASASYAASATPDPVVEQTFRPSNLVLRTPPAFEQTPYRIGVGDTLLLATPQAGSTVEQLSGLLAASNSRQGYTVQDDGSIAIPNVGRVSVLGQTLEEAEARLFQALVNNQIDPTFSLEITGFNSKRVAIGGAVANATVVPITLTPLYLDEALAAAGGIVSSDPDYTSIRLYRDGTLYQIPLNELYSNSNLERIPLKDGDSLFVDTAFELDRAQAYFAERIRIAEFRQSERSAALSALNTEMSIRRGALAEERANYRAQLELGAVERDYVYLTGEVANQTRYALPYGQTANLADALFGESGGLPARYADAREIYVLRGSPDPREFSALTAWNLDARDASNLVLATRFELRPNDVIFVAEQPVTRWNRVVSQITPSLLTSAAARLN